MGCLSGRCEYSGSASYTETGNSRPVHFAPPAAEADSEDPAIVQLEGLLIRLCGKGLMVVRPAS